MTRHLLSLSAYPGQSLARRPRQGRITNPGCPALCCQGLAQSPSSRTLGPRLLENPSLGRVLSPILAFVHSSGTPWALYSPSRENPQRKELVKSSLLFCLPRLTSQSIGEGPHI